MTWRTARWLALALSSPCTALAQWPLPDSDAPMALAAPPAGLSAHTGAPLPLTTAFTDETGRTRSLEAVLSGATPVLLAVGYDRCPQLCGLVLQGALEAGHATGLPGSAYRLVFISIDPRETPADAAARAAIERRYARFVAGDGTPPRIDALVGVPAAIDALTRSLGYRYATTPEAGNSAFAHPAALFVLTSTGRLVRALGGVRFDPADLRTALADAADGKVQGDTGPGIADRIALLCAHVDPRAGHWTGAVMAGLRILGLAILLALAALAWRTRRGSPN